MRVPHAPAPAARSTSPSRPPVRRHLRRALSTDVARRRWRVLVPAVVAVVAVGALGWYWFSSLVPSSYSVMDMGRVDYGGGPAHAHGAAGVSVADLTAPADGDPDVAVTLAARARSFDLASGERVQGYTLNGSSPGPAIQAHQGDLVQVTLTNVDVPDGVTLHWHGVDVPNAEDGVAGVTQDAVLPGKEHVYRFVAEDAGTYWYHSHQVSNAQVRGGLFGTFVVLPADPTGVQDVVAPVHTYSGRRTLGGRTGLTSAEAATGATIRVRLINTDNGPLRAWGSGGPFTVAAVDGRDFHGPSEVRDKALLIAAGGRMDVLVTSPARVDVGAATALEVSPRGPRMAAPPEPPRDDLDLLSYGTPAALPFDPDEADRHFDYRIGRRIG